jgi:hypothetical protein
MRILRSAVLLLVAATPLAAQGSRFSITPLAGWSGSTPLLQHTIRINDGIIDYTSKERVTLGSALSVGARLGVHLSPGWTLYLQGASARSRLTYRDTTTERDASGVEITGPARQRMDDATSSTATLELARSFALAPGGTNLEVSVGGGLQHLSFTPRASQCDMQESPCFVDLPMPTTRPLDVPGAVAGVALRQPIGRALSAELRSTLLLGRVNTEGIRIEMAGDYARYSAPAHRMVRSLHASFGLSWRP